MKDEQPKWRVGGKVPLNVYEGDRPMFQCHTPEDAARVVAALNVTSELYEALEHFVRWVSGSPMTLAECQKFGQAVLAKARGTSPE